ncbi:MAG: DMT family transporter [Thermoguttaceae bacterium]|nr:DMT family transporter [Thermoguttaceae bacterium]
MSNTNKNTVELSGADALRSSEGFLSKGFFYGAIAAIFYTVSALCVRQLVAMDSPYALPLFVRESVAALVALPIVLVGLIRHTIPTNQWRFWGLLFGVSCLMQVLGNITYIWLFDMAGIAIALSCVWTGGLFSAQTFDLLCLKERFNVRTFIGLTIVLAAVCCIGIGLGLSDNTLSDLSKFGAGAIALIILGGLLVGIMNSSTMASVRVAHKNNVPFWVPILLVPGSGTIVLGILSWMEHGSGILTALTYQQFGVAFLAGVANLIAFAALVKGLGTTSLAYMNLLNASQVALGALAGIFWFMEPSNGFIIAGIILTIAAILTAK